MNFTHIGDLEDLRDAFVENVQTLYSRFSEGELSLLYCRIEYMNRTLLEGIPAHWCRLSFTPSIYMSGNEIKKLFFSTGMIPGTVIFPGTQGWEWAAKSSTWPSHSVSIFLIEREWLNLSTMMILSQP